MKIRLGFAVGVALLGLIAAGAPVAAAAPFGGVVGGEALSQIVCEEDSCVVLPSPPDDPTPGTLVPGPGNPPVHFPKAKKGKGGAKKGKGAKGKSAKKGNRHRGSSRR